nr:MAG TPA: hypothetical protein [Caudoviricetes sp.]
MVKYKFTLPIYNIKITLIQIEDKFDFQGVKKVLSTINVQDEYLEEVQENIENGSYNGGVTFRNMKMLSIVVIFYPMKSETIRAEVYSHEKRHIEDRILEWMLVKDIESAGLLAGYLGIKLYQFTNKVLKLSNK